MWVKDGDQCFGQICTREYYIAFKKMRSKFRILDFISHISARSHTKQKIKIKL